MTTKPHDALFTGGWSGALSLCDLFHPNPKQLPALVEHVPGYTLLLHDLSHTSNQQLRSWALAAFPMLALWLLRDARTAARLFANLDAWTDKFDEALRTPNGVETVALLLRYIAEVCDDDDFCSFREKIREQLPQTQQAAMTFAEKLRQEGRQEGRQEAQREMLELMLERKFHQVPSEYVARLASITRDDLDQYVERILNANSIAEVFAAKP